MLKSFLVAVLAAFFPATVLAQDLVPTEGDVTLRDFRLSSGEVLPELRLHYRTLGQPRRDAAGRITNAVLIVHGTTGSGAQFLRPGFPGELFVPGGLLDVTRYYIVLPDAIRNDPAWKGGDYSAQPPGLRTAMGMLFLMSSNPVVRQQDMQTLAASDAVYDAWLENAVQGADANDLLYQVQASWDYDPGKYLERIEAPLVAINFADDLINPPELGILEREIRRVPHGRTVLIPAGPETRGHGTHTLAALWKEELARLLSSTE